MSLLASSFRTVSAKMWSSVWPLAALCMQTVLCSVPGAPARQEPSWGSLRNWLPGSHSQVGLALHGSWAHSGPPSRSRLWQPPLQPIAVQCQEASMVVSVKRDLFGTGKLVQAEDLRLGAAFCKYTSLSADNTVTFQVQLQDCGNTVQVTPEFLVYSSILTYAPTPSSSQVITRTNQAAVIVECLYPRNSNVSSKAIKPTWIPFSSTVYAEANLAFALHLMNDDWLSVRSSNIFQLGEVFKIEASVYTGNHLPMRIFVDSCVATLSADQNSHPQYEIVVANGCMVDGKLSDGSAFISPRTQPDRLQFTVDAFRFIEDPRSTIFITCSLRAVLLLDVLDSVNKACSFKPGTGWVPVEGPSRICSCCEAMNCSPGGTSRATYPFASSRRFQKRGEQLQELALGPITVLDENAAETGPSLYVSDQSSGHDWQTWKSPSEPLEAEAVQGEAYGVRKEDQNLDSDLDSEKPLEGLQTEQQILNKGFSEEDLELLNWPQDGRQSSQEVEVPGYFQEKDFTEMEKPVEITNEANPKESLTARSQPTYDLGPMLVPNEQEMHSKGKVQQPETAQPVTLELHGLAIGTKTSPQQLTVPENKTLTKDLLQGVKTAFLRALEVLGGGFGSTDAAEKEPKSMLESQFADISLEGTLNPPTEESRGTAKFSTVLDAETPLVLVEQGDKLLSVVHSGPIILGDLSEEPFQTTISNVVSVSIDNPSVIESGKGVLGRIPQLAASQMVPLEPLLVLEDYSVPAAEGKMNSDLLDTHPKDHEKLVELLLLVVAGVVLVCMVILGGFLVYRRRNHSFV